eukprot:gnl/Chilomastix_caulleri/1203.p1 GENE.gnl/Chilomastix_caulleri/1203~~gnl/Chilomastix_caulleri/1203.p1  ORF type:complete len:122 (+),score=28.47 gnl/Chilomastix_caulleri/1203:247-612(+)
MNLASELIKKHKEIGNCIEKLETKSKRDIDFSYLDQFDHLDDAVAAARRITEHVVSSFKSPEDLIVNLGDFKYLDGSIKERINMIFSERLMAIEEIRRESDSLKKGDEFETRAARQPLPGD